MRTPAEVLQRLLSHVPPAFWPLRPVLAAHAGALSLVESLADAFAAATTIAGAEGMWLNLLARGYGVDQADGEADDSLRTRLRNIEDRLTVAAIESAATALLDSGDTVLIEHWAAPHMALDIDAACDVTVLYDEHHAFTLIAPADQPTNVYAAIHEEVEQGRAAGVRWWLLVES